MITLAGLQSLVADVQNQVRIKGNEMVATPSLNAIPDCTVVGYDVGLLRDLQVDPNTKLPMLDLYDVRFDPNFPNASELSSSDAAVINTKQKEISTNAINLQISGIDLSDKEKLLIKLCIEQTTLNIMSNLQEHLSVTIQNHTFLDPYVHTNEINVQGVS